MDYNVPQGSESVKYCLRVILLMSRHIILLNIIDLLIEMQS